MPYAKPPLSKDFLCGRHTKLELHEPRWFDVHDIELVRGVTVARIDTARREVITSGGRRYPYWHLVLACGSTAVPLPVPGGATALRLRSFADAVTLRMTARYSQSAVVVGAGLIGCEAAAGLALRGVATTVVADQPLPLEARFGTEVGKRVAQLLSDTGVRLVVPVTVTAVEENAVRLDTGDIIEADVVLTAVGVRPESGLAEAAGIVTRQGRVVVDEHMHSSEPSVYAAGDVALAWNRGAGRRIPVRHWEDASDQGAIAGGSAAGVPMTWDGVPRFSFTIGEATLKYRGWDTGYEHSRLVEHRGGGFTVWYESGGEVVGVLTLNADDDYERAAEMIRRHTPLAV
jgi:3-phenylpropionate/trans-cinnamate dioxygenase ferredoxin reductase subunit